MAERQGNGTRGLSSSGRPDDGVDYHAVFAALTAPKLVLSPELMILDANDTFLRTIDTPLTAVVGRHYLDVFPLPAEDDNTVERVVASLERVAATGRLEMIGPHRYDLRDAHGRWHERWWITTNVPVIDAGGRVSALLHRAEDVTDIVRPIVEGGRDTSLADLPSGGSADETTAGTTAGTTDGTATDDGGSPATGGGAVVSRAVLDHALAVGSTVGRYAEALVRERRAALELQDSVLTPPPEPPGLRIDVRYRPAVPEVHVGGDWYDAFVQRDGSTTVVVGDVTGHDISAAARMGHLRGVLRAVAYASETCPADTLDGTEDTATGLGLDALATVAVARFAPGTPGAPRKFAWASAGHLPPLVRAADGSARLLLAPPDPMLGLGLGGDRHDHDDALSPGDTLVLYTDGLVERRDRSLRDVLAELPDRVAGLGAEPPEHLLDALLAELVPGGPEDDVALVAVHLEP